MKKLITIVLLAFSLLSGNALISQTYFDLSSGSFTQDWTNTGLITTNNDWSSVPGIIGYRGDGLTSSTGVDPQTVLADSLTVVNINANQTSPSTFTSGGICEFEITNPVVAFQGSGTADAPFLVFFMNSTNVSNIQFSCNLRDVDAAADNSVQPVAFQYRVGTTGNFTNIPAAFTADASTGPSLDTLVTPVSFTLPSACDNQPQIQIRAITANAVGSDELIGIDDINIAGTTASAPTKLGVTSVNGGTDPYVNTGYYAVVKSLDVNDIPSAVPSNVNFSITLATGSGILGGTLTGTIPAGTSADTVFGITYNTAETGVSITATDDAAVLTSGTSALFTVQALPPAAVKLAVTDINAGVDPIVGQIFTATIETHDITGNPVNVVSNVNITLSAIFGTGTLGGIVTGTINSGANSVTITGIVYDVAENNIAIKAVDDASVLTADTSVLFNVLDIPAVPALVITEIMYNPPESGIDSLEFIEIYNNDATAVPLKNMTFSSGIVYTFKDDTLQPGNYYIVCVDSVAFFNFFGVTGHKWTSGGLSNAGEAIAIKDSFGSLIDSVFYQNAAPWPTTPNGSGPSLVLCDPDLDNNAGANWFASAEFVDSLNLQAVAANPGTGCITTGINTYSDASTDLNYYPNPVSDEFTIEFTGTASDISLFDISGNRVYKTEKVTSPNTIITAYLCKGIYLLKVTIDNKVITRKVSVM
ncbi:MAG: lamin tail domain-containing protein [Bacteroidota bacterium]